MNKIILMGRVGKDLELTTTKNDKKVTKFSIAVDDGKDQNGVKKPALWFNLTAWDKTAETLVQYVKKGNQIIVEGKVAISHQEKEGNKVTYWDVIVQNFFFVDGAKTSDSDSNASTSSSTKTPKNELVKENVAANAPMDEDNLPF